MKRLAAITLVIVFFALPACAQRGGSRGGFSGSNSSGAGFASHGGFSGSHAGFGGMAHPPSFRGGSGPGVRGGPPRFGGGPSAPRGFSPRPAPVHPPARFSGWAPRQGSRPPQFVSHRMPYQGRGRTPFAPTTPNPRQLNGALSHRMPYHSPHDGDRRGGGDHHGGWDHRDRDRDHWRDRDRSRFVFYGWAGYPYWPWWGWGYPYLNGYWNSFDDYDSQPASNYSAYQYPEYDPNQYQEPQQEQPEPERPSYTPYTPPAPSQPEPVAASEIPATTLVFKDGRPNEQIHNYLLTARTLSILDRNRRDIPVDQIDVAATEKANRATGVEFAIPGGGR